MKNKLISTLVGFAHQVPSCLRVLRVCSVWLLLSLFVSAKAAEKSGNVAYMDSHVRITVLSDGVVRLEYVPDGHFVDEASFICVNRNYPEVEYKTVSKKDWIEISTPMMSVLYKKDSGKFTKENLCIKSSKNLSPAFEWRPGMTQQANLKGTYRTLDGLDGEYQRMDWVKETQSGQKISLEDGLLAKDGWTLIDDSHGFLFDGNKDWNWVKPRAERDEQDWYFMAYGHDYKMALKEFTQFSGKIPLPPRYTFGYWWSRYWSYSDNELRQLVDKFNLYQIPLDVLVVDMDWHYTEPGRGGWTGWTWNRNLFPEPEKFLSYLQDNRLKVTLNLHPADGVASYEEKYKQIAEDMGINPSSGKKVDWVSSDKRFIKSMFKHILHPMQEKGVSFWWLDWQQHLYDTHIANLSNTWWINYIFFSDMERRNQGRPLLYHRWGGLGNHRYQIGFSGDAFVTWNSLNFQPYFNSTASNVLYGYWSHDIGGHLGDSISPELYVRWLQFGAMSPVMRTHSSKSASLRKEPWFFGDKYLNVIRDIIVRRYEMVPYIYTMARKAYDEGLSLCRPMYYEYPECQEAYDFRNEYMFGDNMIVCPVTVPGNNGYAKVKVWLPKGEWYELYTGERLQGGRVWERSFAIDEYPVYVKAASVIPMYDKEVRRLDRNDEDIVLNVFPGKGESSFLLYEDAGNDCDYDKHYATTSVKVTAADKETQIIVENRKGEYANMPSTRHLKIKLCASCMPDWVTVNGKKSSCSYLPAEASVLIDLGDCDLTKSQEIKVGYPAARPRTEGFIKASKRLLEAVEALKYRDAGIVLKDELGSMASICESVAYHPENINVLLESFWKKYDDMPAVLERQGLSAENRTWFLEKINWAED